MAGPKIKEEPINATPISFCFPEHYYIRNDVNGSPPKKMKKEYSSPLTSKVSTKKKMTETPTRAQSMMSKRGRRPKTPPTWIMHWDIRVKKRPNSDRVDKTYRHKVEGFQCRSLIEVARYETQGIRPRRSKVKTKDKEESRSRTKTVTKKKIMTKGKNAEENKQEKTEEMLVAERKEAAEDMRPIVEDFLSQAHYKQIHMVKPRATESAMLYM